MTYELTKAADLADVQEALLAGIQFPTRTALSAARIASSISMVTVAKYGASGPVCAHKMARYSGDGTPSVPAPCRTQSADGTWWVISDEIIDPKMLGAVGDGATDDLVAVQAAIDMSVSTDYYIAHLYNGARSVVFSSGGSSSSAYGVSAPIILKSGVYATLNKGAMVKALAGFTGQAVFSTPLDNTNVAYVTLCGTGIINGNGVANKGFDGRKISKSYIGGGSPGAMLQFNNCPLGGIEIGSQSYSFEVYIDSVIVEAAFAATWAARSNDPSGVAIWMNTISDCYISRCIVYGYRYGVRGSGATCFWQDMHVITAGNALRYYGPMVRAFDVQASNQSFLRCYADTPTAMGDGSITDVYGYYCADNLYGIRLIDCYVYLNWDDISDHSRFATNLCTGVRWNSAEKLSIRGMQFYTADNSVKFKKLVSGTPSTLDRSGISYFATQTNAVLDTTGLIANPALNIGSFYEQPLGLTPASVLYEVASDDATNGAYRYLLSQNGLQQWGPAKSSSTDVTLSRAGVGLLGLAAGQYFAADGMRHRKPDTSAAFWFTDDNGRLKSHTSMPSNKNTTGFIVNRNGRVTTSNTTIAVAATEDFVVINRSIAGATAVSLPGSPVLGQQVRIKDGKGDASTNNITISPAAGTIDGQSTYVINTNYGKVTLMYGTSEWHVMG